MSDTIYTPHPGSLASRMIMFFEENPDAVLSIADVRKQFGPLNRAQDAYSGPRAAIEAGAIIRVDTRGEGITYRRGDIPPRVLPLGTSERMQQAMAAPSVGRRGVPAQTGRPFACALFSDGRMQLNVGGAELTLMPTETTRLIRYLARMGEDVQEAA